MDLKKIDNEIMETRSKLEALQQTRRENETAPRVYSMEMISSVLGSSLPKLDAIKHLTATFGLTLRQAKDLVDTLRR